MKYFNHKNSLKKTLSSIITFFLVTFYCVPAFSEAAVSVEVRENIDNLIKTNTCSGCNLVGADLNRINLSGADLRNADLTGATFFLADLSNANLSGAILRGAQFGGADLAQADLRGADLRGAIITGAYTVGSLMDGKVVDKENSDKDVDMGLYEKVFVPADDKAKESPDKQDVKIAKRRDFDPVPPVIEETKLQKGDGKQGPSALAYEQAAPPVKSVPPVGHITITEQQALPAEHETAIEKAPSMEKEQVIVPDQGKLSQELVASKKVKVQTEPESPDLTDAKKTSVPVKTKPANSPKMIKGVPEGTDKNTVSGNDPVAVLTVQNDEKPAVQPETKTPLMSSAKEAKIEETDLVVTDREVEQMPAQMEAENADNKQVDKQEQKTPGFVEGTAAAPEKTVAETVLPSDGSKPLQPSKDTGETQASTVSQPLVDGIPDTAAVPAAGQVSGDSNPVINGVKDTAANYNRLLATEKCPGCDLAGVDLKGKRLGEADLERADLSGAVLEDVDLSKANLKGVSFRNANLKNSDLRKADLYKADFSGADLTGADFEGALMDETKFTGAIGYHTEIMSK